MKAIQWSYFWTIVPKSRGLIQKHFLSSVDVCLQHFYRHNRNSNNSINNNVDNNNNKNNNNSNCNCNCKAQAELFLWGIFFGKKQEIKSTVLQRRKQNKLEVNFRISVQHKTDKNCDNMNVRNFTVPLIYNLLRSFFEFLRYQNIPLA